MDMTKAGFECRAEMIEGVTGTRWGYLYWPMSFEKSEEGLLICVLIFQKV
jgi:hypothetical protein